MAGVEGMATLTVENFGRKTTKASKTLKKAAPAGDAVKKPGADVVAQTGVSRAVEPTEDATAPAEETFMPPELVKYYLAWEPIELTVPKYPGYVEIYQDTVTELNRAMAEMAVTVQQMKDEYQQTGKIKVPDELDNERLKALVESVINND